MGDGLLTSLKSKDFNKKLEKASEINPEIVSTLTKVKDTVESSIISNQIDLKIAQMHKSIPRPRPEKKIPADEKELSGFQSFQLYIDKDSTTAKKVKNTLISEKELNKKMIFLEKYNSKLNSIRLKDHLWQIIDVFSRSKKELAGLKKDYGKKVGALSEEWLLLRNDLRSRFLKIRSIVDDLLVLERSLYLYLETSEKEEYLKKLEEFEKKLKTFKMACELNRFDVPEMRNRLLDYEIVDNETFENIHYFQSGHLI